MFFNSLFFPLFSLLFSSRTHSLSHAHALSYLLALFSVVYVVHGNVEKKERESGFSIAFFDLFLSECTKKMSKKEEMMDSSFKRQTKTSF